MVSSLGVRKENEVKLTGESDGSHDCGLSSEARQHHQQAEKIK